MWKHSGACSEAQRSLCVHLHVFVCPSSVSSPPDYIKRMQTLLKDLVSPAENPDAHLAYITHDDIRQVSEFKEKVVMAIKAPLGTELFVRHNTGGKWGRGLRHRRGGGTQGEGVRVLHVLRGRACGVCVEL